MTARTLPPVVPAATLRVYQPLAAFAEPLRPRLLAATLRADADLRAEQAERALAWRRVRGRPGLPAEWDGAAVRVLRRDGGPLVCPVDPSAATRPRTVLVRAWQLPEGWLCLARAGERRADRGGCYLSLIHI